MSQETQAEMFIRTLTEMWEEDLERRKARLRLDLKTHVRRFVEEFHSERHGRRRHLKVVPKRSPNSVTTEGMVPGE